MVKPKKIILVSAKYHPVHNKLLKICEKLAEERGLEFEFKDEDYVFLTDHGVKDDFGFAGIPQVFIEYDNGEVKPVLWEIPFDEKLKPDENKMRELIVAGLEI